MRHILIGIAAVFIGCIVLACVFMVAYGNMTFATGFVLTIIAWLIYELVKKIKED